MSALPYQPVNAAPAFQLLLPPSGIAPNLRDQWTSLAQEFSTWAQVEHNAVYHLEEAEKHQAEVDEALSQGDLEAAKKASAKLKGSLGAAKVSRSRGAWLTVSVASLLKHAAAWKRQGAK